MIEAQTYPAAIEKSLKIIKFSADSIFEVDIEYIFRKYYYVIIDVKLKLEKKTEIDCLDTNCSITLINRLFFSRAQSNLAIRIITSFITIRELRFNVH